MIDLHQLSMHYALPGGQRIDVLRQIDLLIPAGQSVAVAGPLGSGKTSMLLLLAGLEQPAAGSVAIGGVRLDALDRAVRALLHEAALARRSCRSASRAAAGGAIHAASNEK